VHLSLEHLVHDAVLLVRQSTVKGVQNPQQKVFGVGSLTNREAFLTHGRDCLHAPGKRKVYGSVYVCVCVRELQGEK
jgi:hypothetical protein